MEPNLSDEENQAAQRAANATKSEWESALAFLRANQDKLGEFGSLLLRFKEAERQKEELEREIARLTTNHFETCSSDLLKLIFTMAAQGDVQSVASLSFTCKQFLKSIQSMNNILDEAHFIFDAADPNTNLNDLVVTLDESFDCQSVVSLPDKGEWASPLGDNYFAEAFFANLRQPLRHAPDLTCAVEGEQSIHVFLACVGLVPYFTMFDFIVEHDFTSLNEKSKDVLRNLEFTKCSRLKIRHLKNWKEMFSIDQFPNCESVVVTVTPDVTRVDLDLCGGKRLIKEVVLKTVKDGKRYSSADVTSCYEALYDLNVDVLQLGPNCSFDHRSWPRFDLLPVKVLKLRGESPPEFQWCNFDRLKKSLETLHIEFEYHTIERNPLEYFCAGGFDKLTEITFLVDFTNAGNDELEWIDPFSEVGMFRWLLMFNGNESLAQNKSLKKMQIHVLGPYGCDEEEFGEFKEFIMECCRAFVQIPIFAGMSVGVAVIPYIC